MVEYMLDTDIVSYIMNGKSPNLLQKLQALPTSAVCVSAVTKSEISYGVGISRRQEKDRAALEFFLRHIQALDYPADAAADYGSIRAELKSRGAPIGPNDTVIEAHARCLGLTLVTKNTREFGRSPASGSRTGRSPTVELLGGSKRGGRAECG